MKTMEALFKELTLADLRDWAGSKIYTRGEDYVTKVSQLSRTEEGRLIALVAGSDQYLSTVWQEDGEIGYSCTCPYKGLGPCKHVVAVLLAAAGQLRLNQEIPLLKPDNPLYQTARLGAAASPAWQRNPEKEQLIGAQLNGGQQQALQGLGQKVSEKPKRMRDAARLEESQVTELTDSLRKEIRRLAAKETWYDPWKRISRLPDYSPVEAQLQLLLANGHADAVLDLGNVLWKCGTRQVGRSDDEGTTASAITACLQVVLRALPQTSLTPAKQLLWRIDHALEDEFSLLDGDDAVVANPHYAQEDWREAAAHLKKKLKGLKVPQEPSYSEQYRRKNILSWLRHAYALSGEPAAIIPILEQEADRCLCYELLVQALVDNGQHEQARHWCMRGFQQTRKQARGIAASLHNFLRQLAETEERYDLAAAYQADNFFAHPSVDAYKAVQQAAQRIDAWPAVRAGLLAFLRSGQLPDQDKTTRNWPLPEPEVQRAEPPRSALGKGQFPASPMLITIALLEKRYDDAVALYRQNPDIRYGEVAEKLAKSVRKTHPELTLQIWHSKAAQLIALVKPKAYQQAAVYLRQMHKVYAQDNRLDDWQALLAHLRSQHKAKRRLMEVLDDLERDRSLVS